MSNKERFNPLEKLPEHPGSTALGAVAISMAVLAIIFGSDRKAENKVPSVDLQSGNNLERVLFQEEQEVTERDAPLTLMVAIIHMYRKTESLEDGEFKQKVRGRIEKIDKLYIKGVIQIRGETPEIQEEVAGPSGKPARYFNINVPERTLRDPSVDLNDLARILIVYSIAFENAENSLKNGLRISSRQQINEIVESAAIQALDEGVTVFGPYR
jgi:hypothetical protein